MAYDYDIASWFLEEELEVCPNCGEKKLLQSEPASGRFLVCLACGVIGPDNPFALRRAGRAERVAEPTRNPT